VKVSFDVNHNVLVAQKIHMRYLGYLEHHMGLELIDAIKKGQSIVLVVRSITQLGITVDSKGRCNNLNTLTCVLLKKIKTNFARIFTSLADTVDRI
jgi:hypothetical protein